MSGYVADCRHCDEIASGEMGAVVTWAAQHSTETGHTTIAEPVTYGQPECRFQNGEGR